MKQNVNHLKLILLILFCIQFSSCEEKASDSKVDNLLCEYMKSPVVTDVKIPRFSWIIQSELRGVSQKAYQILVASSLEALEKDAGNCWDSRKIASDTSIHIEYRGQELQSGMTYYWKVRVWDNKGNVTAWSSHSSFTMGLLNESDWSAKWITDGVVRNVNEDYVNRRGQNAVRKKRSYLPSPYYRNEFEINKPVKKAMAYITCLGLYRAFFNGKEVSEDIFTPGWSQYDKRVFYNVYDVTHLLKQGKNAIGAVAGDGWYVQRHHAEQIKLMLQVDIEYEDGGKAQIVTDKNWKVSNDGAVRTSDMFNGEVYDARKEMAGWSEAGFDDSSWDNAIESSHVTNVKTAYQCEPLRRIMEIKPVEINEPKPGVYVFHFGQNFAGWAKLNIEGNSGDTITMRYAEAVNPDGSIYTANLNTALCTDKYVIKGGQREAYEPNFTYRGFQYVEVTGLKSKPDPSLLTGIVIHNNMDIAGSFESSNPLINKIYQNIFWSQRSNFFEVPTDCPQRNERMGWAGDIQVFLPTGIYNMQCGAFVSKWLYTFDDVQNEKGAYPDFAPLHDLYGTSGWADAALICPWDMYKMLGDKRILVDRYDNMARYIQYMENESENFSRPPTCWPKDWLNYNAVTPEEVIVDAYFAYSSELMSDIASLVGKKEDTRRYKELSDNIKTAFYKNYADENDIIKGNTQTAYLMALDYKLMPEEKTDKMKNYLLERLEERNYYLSTGFLGIKLLFPVLSDIGRQDLCYRLLLNRELPSWGYMVDHGATTMWESWNAWTENGWGRPSHNHYNYGTIGSWMYQNIAGIAAGSPGFKDIVIKPVMNDSVSWCKGSYLSMYGEIKTDWKKQSGNFSLNLTVPANTKAMVYIPVDNKELSFISESDIKLIEKGKIIKKIPDVSFVEFQDNYAVFKVNSGNYRFQSE
jgi:Alpha-L-rhamnosidase N-terminal domain./Bacterial alpha-L-rhamnosidase.